MFIRVSSLALVVSSLTGCMFLQPKSGTSSTGETVAQTAKGPSSTDAGSAAPKNDAPTPNAGGSNRSADKPTESPVSIVSIDFRNECSDKVEYCVESGSSTLNTSLGGNTSTSSTLSPGTKIQLKKNNKCGMTIFTVPESRDRQKVLLCQR